MPTSISNLLLNAKLEKDKQESLPANNESFKNVDAKKFETKLSPEDEKKFQLWLDKNHKEGKIGKEDYDHYKEKGYGYDYDFRAAFKNKASGGIDPVDKQFHWNDYGKKPNHESFSNESMYYSKVAEPGVGGYWGGNEEQGYIKNPKIGAPVPPTKESLVKLKIKKQ